MRKPLAAGLGLLALTALALPSVAAGRGATAQFAPPVKVTPDNGHGYEPTIVSDRYGNLYSTAHKENWQLAIAPDSRETTQTRSMSWAWHSADSGKTWKNLPLGPGNAYVRQPGVEGDMAMDGKGRLYYVDMYLADNTISRWTASGRDKVSFDFSTTVQITGGVDDRPWITAHGDGYVYYIGNSGNKDLYTGPTREGNGYGPGRYTVYRSTDGAKTWDNLGYSLNDSGWCRPAADQTPGSKFVYVICGNDESKVYAYVSADHGQSFNRYFIDDYAKASVDSYPTVEVAKDGTVWALHVSKGESGTETIKLYRSKTRGRTWSAQDITPKEGRFVYTWLAVSPDGKKLGMGAYYRPDTKSPWKAYGAVWTPGQQPKLVSLDDKNPVAPADAANPPGDYIGSSFSPDGKLNVIWTRSTLRPGGNNVARDIYVARQR